MANLRPASILGASVLALPLFLALSGVALALDPSEDDYDLKLLGQYVFFDKISNPPRMACVTCHDPKTGGTGSVSGVNLHQVAITGANPHRVGGLKPPSNAYASFSPPWDFCNIGGVRLNFDWEFNRDGELVLDLDGNRIPAYRRTGFCELTVDPVTGRAIPVEGVFETLVDREGNTITALDPNTLEPIPAFQRTGECDLAPRNDLARTGGQYRFCGGNFWNGRAEGRLVDDAEQYFRSGGTKHIGAEVFAGELAGTCSDKEDGYRKYFGPTSDQALNPMPNPVEQNIEREAVCEHVKAQTYAALYEAAWCEPIDCSDDPANPEALDVEPTTERRFDIAFKRLMLAVGAWQHSADLNSFSSKRDIALRQELACLCLDSSEGVCGEDVKETLSLNEPLLVRDLVAPYYDATVCAAEAQENWGKFPLVGLTDQENLGHDIFYNTRLGGGDPPFPELPVAQCSFCHANTAADDGSELFQTYADHAYHNIGTPANPEVPADPNRGLASHVDPENLLGNGSAEGGFRTPTVRNVDLRKGKGFIKAYTHNGWFKSLESLVHFYNTSQVKVRCEDLGILGATEKEALANHCWPEPEWPATAAGAALIGSLGMTAEHEAAVVAYLKTLTDTRTAKAPPPYKSAKK